jgi:hypothetical protein
MVFENVELMQLLTNLIHVTKQFRLFNHQIICLSNLELKAKKILGLKKENTRKQGSVLEPSNH